jgi:glycosyltransferase involved in cell wall biosynthesis
VTLRLVYDYQIFASQRYGGISRYFCALARELAAVDGVTARIVAPLHRNEHIRAMSPRVVTGHYVPPLAKTERAVRALDAMLFPVIAGAWSPDIVHETYYSELPTFPGRVCRVVTVLDMIHERFPQYFPPGDRTAKAKRCAIHRADRVICISESTRRDLIDIHALREDRVRVVHLGYDRLDAQGLTAIDIVGPGAYLLYVGARNGYKNFLAAAHAYALSPLLAQRMRLVCVGGGAFSMSERRVFAQLGLAEDRVVVVSGNDSALAALYSGAAAFVYPSRHEGFGIPPLEAMSLGCPVVCSNAGSIPEVAGDAAEYFDPGDPAAMSAAIERAALAPGRRSELVALGRLRAEKFSWQRCARETLNVYRELIPHGP